MATFIFDVLTVWKMETKVNSAVVFQQNKVQSNPRDPITLSVDDWSVQSPGQHSHHIPFSEGDWVSRETSCLFKIIWQLKKKQVWASY